VTTVRRFERQIQGFGIRTRDLLFCRRAR
jgi:hypothetical protein